MNNENKMESPLAGFLTAYSDAVKRLAINDSGFVFDPMSGQSFSVNACGLELLRLMQKQTDIEKLKRAVFESFDVSEAVLERDLLEFSDQLRLYLR